MPFRHTQDAVCLLDIMPVRVSDPSNILQTSGTFMASRTSVHATSTAHGRAARARKWIDLARRWLRWPVRSIPSRFMAVMLLAEAGDPGSSYCQRLLEIRVDHHVAEGRGRLRRLP